MRLNRDRRALAPLTRLLPEAGAHDEAPFAFDVAVAWLFVGNLAEASRWCSWGHELMATFDLELRQRHRAIRAMIALLGGEVATALAQVEEFEHADCSGAATGVEGRFATTAARVMLATGRLDDAAVWVDRAMEITGPAVVTEVTVPALDAWLALDRGQLRRATDLAMAACARAEELGMRPHHGSSEALVVAGWCHVALGDLAAANSKCEAARGDAELLGVPWNRIRSAMLAAEIQRLGTSPDAVADQYLDRLTPRELRLLHFLPSHLSYAEIGERLFISVNTVKTNLKALYRKLGANTRAGAVEAAGRAGLLLSATASDDATAATSSAH